MHIGPIWPRLTSTLPSRMKIVIALGVVLSACCIAFPQDEGDDNPTGNVHLGMPVAAPLNPMSQFSNLGWGVSTGGGYNFTREHAVIGEFMWTHLFVPGTALAPIRAAQRDPTITGSGELYSFTGNYRFELRGKVLGTYLIAGGGLYHRTAELSRKVTTTSGVTCQPTWVWWGFSCSSGTIVSNETIGSTSSSALGVNGGFGFTHRVSDAPYRVYVESRYHFAPTKGVNTQLIVITLGIRY
jgi:Outer membrane protein beta-barrel domain